MKLMPYLAPKPRPYWHIDAKWICGILLFFALIATLLLATLVQLTGEQRASKLAALAIGSLFIRDDSLDNIDETRKEIRQQGGALRPLPNMPDVVITENDLKLSPDEIKLKVFQPLTKELYQSGIEATAARHTADETARKKFVEDAALLSLFTKTAHGALKDRLIIGIVLCLVFLTGVVYFSSGWGRLANPGFLLLAVSVPGSLLGLMLSHPPKNGSGGPLGFLPSGVAQEISLPIGQTYQWVALLGLALLVAAFIGKMVSIVVAKKIFVPHDV